MHRRFLLFALAVALLAGPGFSFGQTRSTEVELLKKEIDLLKRELELLKRENEVLKQENAALKKGGSGKSTAPDVGAVTRVTVDNVEYVYQGGVRVSGKLIVTVLATSMDGLRQGPNGAMILIDEQGEKYSGKPIQGFGARPMLREGIPVKLMWQFGGTNAFSGALLPTPSAKVTRYAGVIIQQAIAGGIDTIDFRNVPAVITKSSTK